MLSLLIIFSRVFQKTRSNAQRICLPNPQKKHWLRYDFIDSVWWTTTRVVRDLGSTLSPTGTRGDKLLSLHLGRSSTYSTISAAISANGCVTVFQIYQLPCVGHVLSALWNQLWPIIFRSMDLLWGPLQRLGVNDGLPGWGPMEQCLESIQDF